MPHYVWRQHMAASCFMKYGALSSAELASLTGWSRKVAYMTCANMLKAGHVERVEKLTAERPFYYRSHYRLVSDDAAKEIGNRMITVSSSPEDLRREGERRDEAALRYVRTHPGCTTRDVADGIGDRYISAVSHALRQLEKWRLVRSMPVWTAGNRTRMWHAEECRWPYRCIRESPPNA